MLTVSQAPAAPQEPPRVLVSAWGRVWGCPGVCPGTMVAGEGSLHSDWPPTGLRGTTKGTARATYSAFSLGGSCRGAHSPHGRPVKAAVGRWAKCTGLPPSHGLKEARQVCCLLGRCLPLGQELPRTMPWGPQAGVSCHRAGQRSVRVRGLSVWTLLCCLGATGCAGRFCQVQGPCCSLRPHPACFRLSPGFTQVRGPDTGFQLGPLDSGPSYWVLGGAAGKAHTCHSPVGRAGGQNWTLPDSCSSSWPPCPWSRGLSHFHSAQVHIWE